MNPKRCARSTYGGTGCRQNPKIPNRFPKNCIWRFFSPCHAKKLRKNFLHKKFLITRKISSIKFYISCFIKIFVSPTKKPGHQRIISFIMQTSSTILSIIWAKGWIITKPFINHNESPTVKVLTNNQLLIQSSHNHFSIIFNHQYWWLWIILKLCKLSSIFVNPLYFWGRTFLVRLVMSSSSFTIVIL